MAAETSSGNKIISLALSANDGTLIALTDTFQLMMFNMKEVLANVAAAGGKAGLTNAPVNVSSVKNEFSVFSYPFHCGSITGVDVCQRKPLVVTCGADRSVRVWNYLTMELELSKEFEETVESVALHPTGKIILRSKLDGVN
jgi:WD40 repeat protein